ncbi:hypothetical protein Rhe02_84160 [Rhizocola hellebori]|uniref:Uncharacterized protein n=1 Tax=Rhizocola hellebori TaxID=1392758 RepID=A0A8J3QG27_9ACTN|nr:hypothetical protein Rhe02_84160 [Rhizocola hellebori]
MGGMNHDNASAPRPGPHPTHKRQKAHGTSASPPNAEMRVPWKGQVGRCTDLRRRTGVRGAQPPRTGAKEFAAQFTARRDHQRLTQGIGASTVAAIVAGRVAA